MSFIIGLVLLCLTVASAVCLFTPLHDIVVHRSDQILTTAPRFLAIIPGTSHMRPINEVVDIVLDFGAHVKALCVSLNFDTLSRWIFRVAGICLLTMVRQSAELIDLGEEEYDVKSQQSTLPSPFSDTEAEVDVFAPASPLSEQCDYARYGIPHVSAEDSIWETSSNASTFVEPSIALPRSVHFSSSKAAHPPLASAFVSVATTAVSSLASRTSHCVSALHSRYLSFIAGAHVASAPSSLDLASLFALVSSQSDHSSSSTSNAAGKRAPHRMFGTDVPPRSTSARRQLGGADLEIEIDDGSYLRAALCIADTDGAREGGFWPEIDRHVQRARDGRPGAWYADGDEMRGWVFPGRERVPELESPEEDASESESEESCGEWAVADNEAYEVLQRTVEVVD